MADDPLWWLSFVDPDKAPPLEEQRPGGPSFLGVAIVQAPTYLEAIQRAHRLDINPGGEVASFGPIDVEEINEVWCHRLLTAGEAALADHSAKPLVLPSDALEPEEG